MAGESKTTTNHEEIKRWAEERGGHPATVRRTGDAEEPGILRIDFPGYSGEESLEPISWDEFFQKFDEKNLAFLYQDKTSGGEQSRFFKLISREGHERERGGAQKGRAKRATAKKAGKKAAAKKSGAKKGGAKKSAKAAKKPIKKSAKRPAKKTSAKKGGTRKSSKKSAKKRGARK